MAFTPTLPFGGLQGYRFLGRTLEQQTAAFNKSPDIEREIAYFLDNAGDITTTEALVADRRLLGVVLGAFGLDDDIDKRAFIRKVLDEGTLQRDAFANRLVEPAYREMAEFVGFGDVGGLLIFENTRLNIVDRYRERQFERAVGEQDLDLRLALNFRREAVKIANQVTSEQTFWLRMMGSQPLRSVVEGALFLPSQFGLIDVDQQVEVLRSRAADLLGGEAPAVLRDPGNVERMVERFLLRQQAVNGAASATTPGLAALSLLQSGGLGAGAQQNLFASNFL